MSAKKPSGQSRFEVIQRAALRQRPERIPFFLNTWPGVWKRHPELLDVLRERGLGDWQHDFTKYYGYRDPEQVGHGPRGYVTPFGARVESLDGADIGQPVEHPLGDGFGPLESGAWRPPESPRPEGPELERLRRDLDEMERAGYPRKAPVYCIMHELVALRGFENTMVDLCDRPPSWLRLVDAVVDYCVGAARLAAAAGAQIAHMGDDWGTQTALYCRPAVWREVFGPLYARIVREARRTGAIFYFHSDGHVADVIPDLIDMGVDIVNPQLSCHDWPELRDAFGGRACIAVDLDRQHVLARGSPAEIKEHVHKATEFFGSPEGGFIIHAELSPDMSWEQVVAVLDGYEECARRSAD